MHYTTLLKCAALLVFLFFTAKVQALVFGIVRTTDFCDERSLDGAPRVVECVVNNENFLAQSKVNLFRGEAQLRLNPKKDGRYELSAVVSTHSDFVSKDPSIPIILSAEMKVVGSVSTGDFRGNMLLSMHDPQQSYMKEQRGYWENYNDSSQHFKSGQVLSVSHEYQPESNNWSVDVGASILCLYDNNLEGNGGKECRKSISYLKLTATPKYGEGAGPTPRTPSFINKPQHKSLDFDGDAISDLVIRRPSLSSQITKNSGDDSISRVYFDSQNTDIPVSGDFDGDGLVDIASFRMGTWVILQSSDNVYNYVELGTEQGDLPIPADYDGDGITDIAIRRPSTGQWVIRQSSQPDSYLTATFGIQESDIPVPADYDGDGKADIAIRRPSSGQFIYRRSSDDEIVRTTFGLNASDIPVPNDYDGDGLADIAIRRPSNGFWFIRNSSDNSIKRVYFGSQDTDIPVAADYDGDGITDIAIRRPSIGMWFILNSSDNTIARTFFGNQANDIPLAAPLAQRIAVLHSGLNDTRILYHKNILTQSSDIPHQAVMATITDEDALSQQVISNADMLAIDEWEFTELKEMTAQDKLDHKILR
ncbi:FG-GAP repeat domain-containing protein [Alteromonas gracilis]|uniref:FG-GAP repeat domain-containing protein n=1 Tax=Alteromonas gracilis TaxID=1479524 RepID=UPI002FE26CE0